MMGNKCPFMCNNDYRSCMGNECQLWNSNSCSLSFGELIYEQLKNIHNQLEKLQDDKNNGDIFNFLR